MKCPACGHTWKNQANARAGAKGGAARNPAKGFGTPTVLQRALDVRRASATIPAHEETERRRPAMPVLRTPLPR